MKYPFRILKQLQIASKMYNIYNQQLSELKSQMKVDEEEHRKEEFEDRLNYLLSKLDVISKISDK